MIYQVKVGEQPAFYDTCIASVARYCARYGIDHLVQTEPLLKIAPLKSCRSTNALRLGYLPIYEKEAAFAYLDRYDRIAVIDADVYIRPSAPNIFEQPMATFAAVVEREMPLDAKYFEKIRKHSVGQFDRLRDVDWKWDNDGAHFFNMGVMMFDSSLAVYLNGDTPEQFIRRPEFERFVNGESHWRWSTDQTLLNWWLKSAGIPTTSLDWRFNALYGGVVRDALPQAHFIHFFLSAKMARGGDEIPEIISRL